MGPGGSPKAPAGPHGYPGIADFPILMTTFRGNPVSPERPADCESSAPIAQLRVAERRPESACNCTHIIRMAPVPLASSSWVCHIATAADTCGRRYRGASSAAGCHPCRPMPTGAGRPLSTYGAVDRKDAGKVEEPGCPSGRPAGLREAIEGSEQECP